MTFHIKKLIKKEINYIKNNKRKNIDGHKNKDKRIQ